MSRTKGVVIDGQLRWVWSDTHDIVLALMVEVAAAVDFVPAGWVQHWRVSACIPDLALSTAEAPTHEERDVLRNVLHLTRELALQRGDVTNEQVNNWTLGEGLVVSDGSLRTDKVTVEQMVEVIDAYLKLLAHESSEQTVLGGPR